MRFSIALMFFLIILIYTLKIFKNQAFSAKILVFSQIQCRFFECSGMAVFCANVLSSLEPMENWKMILAIMLLVVALILHIMQSLKLARAFGKGTGFGICLILFGPIARLVLGFGSARYIGKE